MDGKSMDMMVNEEVLVSQRTFNALIYSSLLLLFFIVVGCFLLPHLFWDGFVVKYLWGPVLADAGVPGAGVKPGYNVINTAVYAYVLFLSLLIIHRLLVRFGIKVDRSFYLSLTPLIISGPLLRTLEDSGFFIPPSSYLFISPLIYIYLGLGALLSIGVGVWCEGRGRACDILSSLPALLTPGMLLLFSLKELTLLSPVIYSLLLPIPPMLTYLFLRWKVKDQLLPLKLFSSFTLLSALLPYFLLPSEAWPYLPRYHPLPIIVALGGASLVAWLFILLTRLLLRKSPSHYPAPSGINAAIVFGHTLDALATAWAVDFLSYTEKHVLPRFLFQITGTAFSIIPIKIALVVLVLYTLDVYMRVESRRNPTIFGLIKLAILILGLGPGLRDITRVAVGV